MTRSVRALLPGMRAGIARELMRFLDGPMVWGSVVVTENPRAQWSRYVVTVYPPGTTVVERRMMRAHRGWPLAGALLAAVAVLVLGESWPIAVVLPSVVLVYAAGCWTTSQLTADLRRRSVTMRCAFVRDGGVDSIGEADAVAWTLATFQDLDHARAVDLSLPAFEARWGLAYDALRRRTDSNATDRQRYVPRGGANR